MTPTREAILLAAVCALVYLTAASERIPFFTRGEPREALVVREMLASGEWLVPARPEGELARKPPLYYWAAAAASRVMPARPETALRLPSVLLGTAGVLTTWATARLAFGAAAGLPAGLVLATALEWMRAAAVARVDMTMASALAAVLAGLALALAGPPSRRALGPLLAGGAAALGALAKGPVAILLPALAVGAFLVARRDPAERARLRPVLIVAIAGAGALLWYIAAALQSGPAFIDVVVRENLLRFLDTEAAETGHAHGVGYLLGVGLVGLLPWTPLLVLAAAPLARRPRPAVAALAGRWVATGFAFFALASSKRSVYLLPLYPAFALLVGAAVAAPPVDGRLAAAARATARLYAPLLALLAAALLVLTTGRDLLADLGLARWLRPPDLAAERSVVAAARAAAGPLLLLALATFAAVPFVARAARTPNWSRLVALVAGVTLAWTTAFGAFVFPTIAEGGSLRTFLARVATLADGAPLYARGTIDPGLRYYAPPALARWPVRHTAGGLLLVWEDEWRRLRDGEGHPLRVVTVSEMRQGSRGHLALVRVPPGRLTEVTEAAEPPEPPGLRTGR